MAAGACYECLLPSEQTDKTLGEIVLRLCTRCLDSYFLHNPCKRLVAKSEAARAFRLRGVDLAPLPHARATNPVNPSFLSMYLYRTRDVREAAAKRWGGWERAQTARRGRRAD